MRFIFKWDSWKCMVGVTNHRGSDLVDCNTNTLNADNSSNGINCNGSRFEVLRSGAYVILQWVQTIKIWVERMLRKTWIWHLGCLVQESVHENGFKAGFMPGELMN